MFLKLSHTKLDVYKASRLFVLECYKISEQLPSEEKFAIVQQLRRAALSIHLNLAEGCSMKSKVERNRFYEISRGSVIEIDAVMDLEVALKYANFEGLKAIGKSIVDVFKLLTGMIDRD